MKTLGVALMGSGRMAHAYGPKINAHPGLRLEVIFNPSLASAQKATELYGGAAMSDLDTVLGDPKIESVIIATPTNTHVDYIIAAAKAGKSIYCEKPLDQTLERVDTCLAALNKHPVPFMMGFNRRFDPDNSALQKAVASGEIGNLSFLMSTSREPSPPPIEYIRASGGYFVDATIHDIDLMCWIAGERPVRVFAQGSCLINPAIGDEGDFDTTMTMLYMPSGAIVHINNSRRCSYGFDQRIEVFGERGLLQTTNHRDKNLVRWDAHRTEARVPLKHFFLERYDASFYNALDEFYDAVITARRPSSTQEDGRAALAIALACMQSAKENRPVIPDYGSR